MIEFYQCLNSRCNVNYWPCSAASECPVCGLSGPYAGVVIKEHTPSTEEELSDTSP